MDTLLPHSGPGSVSNLPRDTSPLCTSANQGLSQRLSTVSELGQEQQFPVSRQGPPEGSREERRGEKRRGGGEGRLQAQTPSTQSGQFLKGAASVSFCMSCELCKEPCKQCLLKIPGSEGWRGDRRGGRAGEEGEG